MPPVVLPARPLARATVWLVLGLLAASAQAQSAAPLPIGSGTLSYAASPIVSSVGDVVSVQLELQQNLAGGPLSYVYRFGGTAVHVPNSVTRNGVVLQDGGAVVVYADSIVVNLGTVPAGTTRIAHQVEVRGQIGQAVVHRGRVGSGSAQMRIGAPTTRIEADNVRWTELTPTADAMLDQSQPGFNYGASSTLRVMNTGLSERRSVLRFDALTRDQLGADELIAGYLELWTPERTSSDVALRVQRVRQNWSEGFLDGFLCLGGVTWNAPDCLLPWTGGGDLGSTIWASSLLPKGEPWTAWNIGGLVDRWESGSDPNDGLAILASTHASATGVGFNARTATNSPFPTPRLRLIHGDAKIYEQRAIHTASAEIVPNDVPLRFDSQRFVYSVDAQVKSDDSGFNRLRVLIPTGFSVVSIDSVLVNGALSARDDDGKLLEGEYQIWSFAGTLDLRFGGTLRDDSDDKVELDLVFHAATPQITLPFGVEFTANLDHDRKGYGWQSASQGSANGNNADANSWRVVVSAPKLVALKIQPGSASVALGEATQFAALGQFNDGVERDVSAEATWSASPPQLSLGPTPGNVRGSAVGVGSVGASLGGKVASPASVTVRPAELRALHLEPSEWAIALGDTARFAAIGSYSDQSEVDHTADASWESSDSAIAQLTSPGAFVGLQIGSAFARASIDTIEAEPGRIDVAPPVLVALVVSPADTVLALGQSAQAMATGEYSNGDRMDLTTSVEWSSFPAGVVDVGADGSVSTLSVGTSFVTAQLDGLDSDPAQFEVTPAQLLSLDGSPDFSMVPAGASLHLHSLGSFTDQSVRDVTDEVVWTSLAPALADFVAAGELQTFGPGEVDLMHSSGNVVGDTLHVSITSAVLDSIRIDNCAPLLPIDVELQLLATAHFSDGTTLALPADATWLSSVPAVASIVAGRLRTLSAGFSSITARWQGVDSAPCLVQVDAASLDQLVLAPADTSVALGEALSYRAFGHVGAAVYDFSASVDWWTTLPSVASIDSTGRAQSLAPGTTGVLAQLGSIVAASAQLQVGPARVVSLRLAPLNSSVLIGRSKQIDAIARYSDGSEAIVNASASWISSLPSIGYVDANGLVVGLAVGTPSISASLDGIACTQAAVVSVLPSMTLLALPTGALESWPGVPDRSLFSLRLSNHYLDVRRLQALSLQLPPEGPGRPASSAMSDMALFADDGDGNFEPAQDTQLARGQAAAQQWTASNLSLELQVGESRTLFVSATPSLLYASHSDTLDAWIANSSAFLFEHPTALVPSGGFAMNSPGFVRVRDLVLPQLAPAVAPPDTVGPGTDGLLVLQFRLPPDGRKADALTQIEVQQLGTARAGSEIERLRLQTQTVPAELDKGPQIELPWTDSVELVHVGNQRFAAYSLGLNVPSSGLQLRVVADIAGGAQLGSTLRLSLPQDGLRFASGRRGPADLGFVNAATQVVDVNAELQLAAYPISTPSVVGRGATQLPLLGLQVSSWSTQPDTLLSLRLTQQSTSPEGTSPDPDRILDRVQLWRDASANGVVGADDELLGSASFVADELVFHRSDGVHLTLAPGIETALLVSADVGAAARDGERLALALASSDDLEFSLGLPVNSGQPPQTQWSTPIAALVDGQDLAGYAFEQPTGSVVFAGGQDIWLLTLGLPANGAASDVLQSLEFLQIGTASVGDLAALELWRDDGDAVFDAGDAKLGALAHISGGRYRLDALSESLPADQLLHLHVSMDLVANPASGGSVRLRLPLQGVQVASGNDGPRDLSYDLPSQFTIAVGERITWVAEAVNSATVAADVQTRPLLVLSEFNGYADARSLTSLDLLEFGSIGDLEIDVWSLHRDADGDGLLDPEEVPIAVATQLNSSVHFEGFSAPLASLTQSRFFVAYSLAPAQARDDATIDLRVPDSSSFGYAGGTTLSSGEFPLDSPGVDVVDGVYARQIQNRPLASRSLGGSERDVLCLDLQIPSNGFEADVLTALDVELLGSQGAALGQDLDALRLYRELDADVSQASFDPTEDLLLASLLSPELPLRFVGFSASIPVGGRRFYVSCDVAPAPTPLREIALGVPVNGIELASSNDGPLDLAIAPQALHTISDSPLLLQVDMQPRLLSRGQEVELWLLVSNRGDSTLSDIQVAELDLPTGAQWILGPLPSSLSLATGESDTLRYRFLLDAPGEFRFAARVAHLSLSSERVEGPSVLVEEPPSALALQTLSNLPLSINRGSSGIIPMSWRLEHPDASGSSADIEIRRLEFTVEDGTGAALPANAVLRRVRVRAQGQELASLDPVDSLASVGLDLVPPLRLSAGELRDLPLEVDIAADASASSFRLRIVDASGVVAVDVHGGQPVPLTASLPWNTPTALLRTAATGVDVGLIAALPARANRGQTEVPAGRLQFDVPGVPGQSEVRLLELALRLHDAALAPVDPAAMWSAVRVRSGTQVLLELQPPSSSSGLLRLPLSLPKVVVSGAPEHLDVFVDFAANAQIDSLYVDAADSNEILARDLNSGAELPASCKSTPPFVLSQGPLSTQSPASTPQFDFQDISLSVVAAGEPQLRLAEFELAHGGLPGEADLSWDRLQVRLVDERSATLVPAALANAIELSDASGTLLATLPPPAIAGPIVFDLPGPPRIAPGEQVRYRVSLDLRSDVDEDWLRLSLDLGGVEVHDANDASRALSPTGDIPAATQLVRVVAPARALALAVASPPPANVLAGATDQLALPLLLRHSGQSNEGDVAVDSLNIRLLRLDGRPLAGSELLSAARLSVADTLIGGQIDGSRIRFALAGHPTLAAGQSQELALQLDLIAAPTLSDFRLALHANDVRAGGGPGLLIEGDGIELPYVSPSIHVLSGKLADTFSSYPNPFAAGREAAQIVFSLEAPAKVSAEIFTLDGRLVRTLFRDRALTAGMQQPATWDGRNGDGKLVRNGSYLLRLSVSGDNGGDFLRKITVLR